MKVPLRLLDWKKVIHTGRGYSWRELTVVRHLSRVYDTLEVHSLLDIGFHDYADRHTRRHIDLCRANHIDWHILEILSTNQEFQLQGFETAFNNDKPPSHISALKPMRSPSK